ncbi:MAG: hypothetical protein WC100_12105 [Sterolibacterium sp.]
MARAGRKRKTNVIRDESGKSRGEIFDPSAIYQQPHRRDLAEPGRTEAGYPLGRLRLNGQITPAQLRAGNAYAHSVYAYARTMGIPMGSPRSGSMSECVSTGFYAWEGDHVEIDHDEARKRVQRVKEQYTQTHEALWELGRHHNRGNKILVVLREICVAEQDERDLWADSQKLGDLRLGLNAVEKILANRNKGLT